MGWPTTQVGCWMSMRNRLAYCDWKYTKPIIKISIKSHVQGIMNIFKLSMVTFIYCYKRNNAQSAGHYCRQVHIKYSRIHPYLRPIPYDKAKVLDGVDAYTVF